MAFSAGKGRCFETTDHPDQGSESIDKLHRYIDRSPTDYQTNTADHHGGAQQKNWVIGAIKAAIGRQLIGKEAQISGKTTLSKR